MKKNALIRKILNGMILSTFGILFSINLFAQESLPSWECTEVSPGTYICEDENGRSYGYHDSTDNGDGSCSGSPAGCRILF